MQKLGFSSVEVSALVIQNSNKIQNSELFERSSHQYVRIMITAIIQNYSNGVLVSTLEFKWRLLYGRDERRENNSPFLEVKEC